MRINRLISLRNCPFCGAGEKDMTVGYGSALSAMIKCKCGVKIERALPNEYTDEEMDAINTFMQEERMSSCDACVALELNRLADQWNRRI